MRSGNRSGGGAFTLLELLLALVVVSILGIALAAPIYQRLAPVSLENATDGLQQVVRHARMASSEYRCRTYLHLDIPQGRYWLEREQPTLPFAEDRSSGPTADPVLPHPRVLPEQVHILSVSLGDNGRRHDGLQRITFYPDGTADPAIIQIGSRDLVQSLVIEPWNGRAQRVAGAVTDWSFTTGNSVLSE